MCTHAWREWDLCIEYTRKYVIEQFVKVVPMLPLMLLIAKLSVPRRLALTHALTHWNIVYEKESKKIF